MYKLTVSCYYWPAEVKGRLRLRNLTITEQLETTRNTQNDSRVGRLTTVAELASSTERRNSRRLRTRCDAELATNLSILDTEAQYASDPLLFFGTTRDLSAGGIAVVLPSVAIDERYCGQSKRLMLTLHLPERVVELQIDPVRCEPLDVADPGQGYLVGARIVSINSHREVLDNYLERLSNASLRG